MPSDALTLYALAKEFNTALRNARVDKIYQPESDEVTILLRAENENKTLVISANPSVPRIHFSTKKKENPLNAPAFCMLLRKYLTGARVQSIELYNYDRIIRFTLSSKSEMMDDMTLFLYFEMMGRYSNVILTDEKNKILDVLRRVPLDMSHTRRLLPSFTYAPPMQEKVSVFNSTALLHVLEYVDKTEDAILSAICGLSRESVRELIFRANEKNSNFAQNFADEVQSFIDNVSPCVSVNAKGNAQDFFAQPYTSIPCIFKPVNSLSEGVDLCFTDKDQENRIRSKSKHVAQIVKNAISRTEKKLGVNLDKLRDCDKAEEYKIKGELITANIYRIQKGMDGVVLQNFYENNEDIKVSLDSTKTPAQNAQNYFRRYTKLKRTKETVVEMIKENQEFLSYLKSVQYDIQSATKESDLKDIEQNLAECGLINLKANPKNKNSTKPSIPLKYVFENTEIYIGRNNLQNDALTFKSALKSDTWLHVKNYHGSHVIIRSGQELSPSLLQFAAELAAFYSEAKTADKVEVDYTKVKNVHRSPAKRAGLVIYTDFSSILVKPQEHKNFLA